MTEDIASGVSSAQRKTPFGSQRGNTERPGAWRMVLRFITHRIHGAGIYANIGDILMVNVTIYTIHGSYGVMVDPMKIVSNYAWNHWCLTRHPPGHLVNPHHFFSERAVTLPKCSMVLEYLPTVTLKITQSCR